jgi:hypothetical protein
VRTVKEIKLTVHSIGKKFPMRFPQKGHDVMSFFEMTSVASLSVGDVFTKIAGLIYLLT